MRAHSRSCHLNGLRNAVTPPPDVQWKRKERLMRCQRPIFQFQLKHCNLSRFSSFLISHLTADLLKEMNLLRRSAWPRGENANIATRVLALVRKILINSIARKRPANAPVNESDNGGNCLSTLTTARTKVPPGVAGGGRIPTTGQIIERRTRTTWRAIVQRQQERNRRRRGQNTD